MSSDPQLQTRVDAVFAALRTRDADALSSRCTPQVTAQLAELMASPTRQFTHFPALLQLGQRAAVRGMAIDSSDTPQALWLGFDGAEEWLCTRQLESRDAVQTWLNEGHDGPAFSDLFADMVDALTHRRGAALRALTHADWQSHAASAERLAHALPSSAHIELGAPPRIRQGRAIAELDIDGRAVWIAAARDDSAVRLSVQLDQGGAMAWLRGDTQRLPVWSTLPEDTQAHVLANTLLTALGGDVERPESADPTAWAILTEAVPDGLQAVVGATRALPTLNRAALQIRLIEASDPDWTEESRWAYLERDASTAPWRVRAASNSGSVDQLLAGLELSWSASRAASNAPDPMQAVRQTLSQALNGDGMPDLKSMFEGVARTFTHNVSTADSSPDVVDLAAERARRTADTSGTDDIGALLRKTLSQALAGATPDEDGKKVTVDADFVSDKGPEIATSLFAALTKVLVPDTVSVDVPSDPLKDDLDESDRDAGQSTRTVDLDLGSMVARLFESARTAPQSHDTDPTDEEDA